MVEEKRIALLSLKYQIYLTYIGVIWTVGISFFVAIWSYIFISLNSINPTTLILLGLLLIFGEIVFIAVYFWVNYKKDNLEEKIKNLNL